MRVVADRPPVVLVVRDGDPTGALAVVVTTSQLEAGDHDPVVAVALAGVVEARLAAYGYSPVVSPSWSGFRAAVLFRTAERPSGLASAVRASLAGPIRDSDVASARLKLAALSARPLRDPSLARWARCVDSPYAQHTQTAPTPEGQRDVTKVRLEAWRARAMGLGRVAFGVVAPRKPAEAVAEALAADSPWPKGAAVEPTLVGAASSFGFDVDVFETVAETPSSAVVYATLDLATGTDAVTTAQALGDPRGALSARLGALEVPFRVREVTGTVGPRGGCVGLVLDAMSPSSSSEGSDVASRVASAVGLVHLEAEVHLASRDQGVDGRALARRSGDPREAASLAAWWALTDPQGGSRARTGPHTPRGSVVLEVQRPRRSASLAAESPLPTKPQLLEILRRAVLASPPSSLDARSRLEPGQGEMWVLVASTCGTEGESDVDAGLTALFTVAAAEAATRLSYDAQNARDVHVEPWIVADGAGLLVHGPARLGEWPTAQARRLAEIAARGFAAEPLDTTALARARTSLLRRHAETGGTLLSVVASNVAPGHSASFLPTGREESLARAADSAVLARAESVRSGPLRVAVLATDAAQAAAALRAADRWVARRVGEVRTCRASTTAGAPRPGTYAVEARSGTTAEAYLAFPFAPQDARAFAAAETVAQALDGVDGLLSNAVVSRPLASRSASVVGWPQAPALVLRIVSSQATLDGDVLDVRTLLSRLGESGLSVAERDRALANASQTSLMRALDPRVRVVATWRAVPSPTAANPLPYAFARPSVEAIREFTSQTMRDSAMVVVAARPVRPRILPP